jgi:hypothetical protein
MSFTFLTNPTPLIASNSDLGPGKLRHIYLGSCQNVQPRLPNIFRLAATIDLANIRCRTV